MTSVDRAPATSPPDDDGRILTRAFVVATGVTLLFFLYVGVMVPLMPRLIEEQLGGTEIDIGLNLAAFSIAAIAIRPWLGRWGDEHGRRALIIGGALVATLAAVVAVFVTDRWTLLPVRAVMGAGEAALFVGAATLVNDIAPAHRRAEAASYFSVAVFGGLGLGPIIGEHVSANGDFDRGLLAAALCSLVAAGAGLTLADDRPRIDRRERAMAAAVAGAAPVARFHRAALRPGLVLACSVAGFAAFNAFVPEHARSVGLDGAQWVFALYSAICLVVRIVGARIPERIGLAMAVTIAFVGVGGGLAVLGIAASPAGLFAGTVLIGIGVSFMYPSLSAIAVNSAPPEARSQVVSTFTMFFEIGTVVGAIVLGTVAELTSKRGGFLGGAVICAMGLVVLWRVLVPWARTSVIDPSESR